MKEKLKDMIIETKDIIEAGECKDYVYIDGEPLKEVFAKQSVKNAVEWLLNEILRYELNGNLESSRRDYIVKTIDVAFEDVFKK